MVSDEFSIKSVAMRASLPLLLGNGGATRNHSFPSFSKGFPPCAFAKECSARCTRGAPVGATGFNGKLLFSDLLCFSTVLARFSINYFRLLDASDRIRDVTQRNVEERWLPFVLPKVFRYMSW